MPGASPRRSPSDFRGRVVELFVLVVAALTVAATQAQEPGDDFALGSLVGRAVAGPTSTSGLPLPADPVPLVLRRVAYDVELLGGVASVLVEQEFENDSPLVLEARYQFPLPPDAAVDFYEMQVGDRVLQGVVREKQEARREFEAAREEGRRASLLEEHRPNVFTASVTNLLPGDRVVVRVAFAMPVAFDSGTFRLRLPLVVARRFHPSDAPDAPLPHAPRVPGEHVARRALSVRCSLPPGTPLLDLASPSHEIRRADEGGWTVLELARDDEVADRDFVLDVRLGKTDGSAVMAWASPARDGWRHLMLFLQPPPAVKADDARAKEVLFVLDTSGSMSSGSLDAAREALLACLERLRPGDRLNITAYESRFRMLADAPFDVDAVSLQGARGWIEGLQASGGTQLLPALEATLSQPQEVTHHRIVVVLTDGYVGNETQVLGSLERNLGDARLFVIGVGTAPNAHLVGEMARLGRGTAEIVSPGMAVQEAALRLFSRVETPLAWDVTLDWRGAEVQDVFPERVPDLYAGLPVAVLARVRDRGPVNVGLVADTPAGVQTFDVHVDPARVPEHDVVTSLWARASIEALEQELRRLRAGVGDPTGEERAVRLAEVRRELVDLSVTHGLVSSATSFVVVEQRVVAPDGPDAEVDVPLAEEAAWPQTATRRPRVLLLGVLALLVGGAWCLHVAVRRGRAVRALA